MDLGTNENLEQMNGATSFQFLRTLTAWSHCVKSAGEVREPGFFRDIRLSLPPTAQV